MKQIQREDIHIINRHSNLTEKGVAKVLKENIYNNREAWQKFLRLLFITLGVGFTVSGVIFFFAYNWTDLHRLAKTGLAEGLIIATATLVLLPKININIRNVILTGASVLVGALFAVYGQIYQTGANAYDFFLGWTVFVTLWVAVSNFAPLWLLYLVLINTTFILYSQQVANDWSLIFIFTALFIINAIILIPAILLSGYRKTVSISAWFLNIVALACASYSVIGIIIGIFDRYERSTALPVLISITVVTFALGILHGLKTKKSFYLAMIPLSLIIIVSALFIKLIMEMSFELLLSLLFPLGLFIIASVTLTVKNLINLQKKWKNEK
jgi:uncharacterized membrane protein